MSGAVKKRDYSLEAPDTKPPHNGVSSSSSSLPPKSIDQKLQRPRPQQKKSLGQVLSSKFFIGIVVICVLFVTLLCIGLVTTYEEDNDITESIDAFNDKLSAEQLFWFNDGLDDLKVALGQKQNTKQAKNVILFVADGMGPSTVTAARIYKEKEEGNLIWERFPHMGMLKVSTGWRISTHFFFLNLNLPLSPDLLRGQAST